jgi:S-DNA-T family DNA segregation ATPase FtsK/SpoIIIE
LEELVQKLEQRQLHFGRNYRSDRDHPLVLIFVDELLVLMHDRDAQRRKRNADALTRILVLGRSHGFYVVAATQAPQKAALEGLRDYFPLRVGLRMATKAETEMVFGAGAADNGFDCHHIQPATEANGYSTAGMGYALMDGDGFAVRIRFPYTDDAYIAAWHKSASAEREAANDKDRLKTVEAA